MTKFEREDMNKLKKSAKAILKANGIKAFLKDIEVLEACTEFDDTVLDMKIKANGNTYQFNKFNECRDEVNQLEIIDERKEEKDMKQIKVEMTNNYFYIEHFKKYYYVSKNNNGTYDLTYTEHQDNHMIIEHIFENRKSLKPINRYLKQKGYEVEFVD